MAASTRVAAALMAATIGGLSLVNDEAVLAAAEPADVCLAVAPGVMPEGAWDALLGSIARVASERPALFPDPALLGQAAGAEPESATQVWITADASAPAQHGEEGDCLVAGAQWSLRVVRRFLDEGADRMLAAAPTTPGIESSVAVEWFPDEARVMTLLEFAGPLGIPNGRCWIDDVLSIDTATGVAVSTVARGLETSPFAESACGRFFDYLVNGGAGEQALGLLPSRVALADGSSLVLVAEDLSVGADAIVISGRVGLD